MDLEKKKALKLGALVLAVITFLILVVSLYNLISFLGTAISGESFGLDMNKNESTGEFVFSFNASPRNDGILPVSMYLEITFFDLDDNMVATNSSLSYIGVDNNQTLSFSLVIPSDFVQGDELQGDEGYMQMTMSIRTLGNLVGLTQILKIGGTGEP